MRTIYRRLQLNKRNGTCSHVKSLRNCVRVRTDDFLNRQASNNEYRIEFSSSYFNNLASPKISTELSQNVLRPNRESKFISIINKHPTVIMRMVFVEKMLYQLKRRKYKIFVRIKDVLRDVSKRK